MTRTGRRVVLILLDGARPDVLRELAASGDLPNLARWVVERGGLTTACTAFPSTTGVAYIPFLFGCHPGTVGIPGIRWLDRARAAGGLIEQWRAARSYCGVQQGWINGDIAGRPSLFDLVPESFAIATPIDRGLKPGRHLATIARMVLGPAAHYFGTYRRLDRAVAAAWLDVADRPWRFLFVVFPGIDGLTHWTDPWHRSVLDRYRDFDHCLGRFVARARLTGETPSIALSSDHGGSVVTEHLDIATHFESLGIPTLRHPVHVWRRGARVAVMVSGNGSVQLYFEPRSGRGTPRTEREIPSDLLAGLLALPQVRVGAYRGDDGGIVVAGGGARARLVDNGATVRYEPLDGDPLGLGQEPIVADDREMFARSLRSGLPDAPRQLLQLFQTPRAGDVVLAAALGADFRGPWEIPEHRAGHGSLIREHMEVPLAATFPLPKSPIRTVDLMPTILEELEIPLPDRLDGLPFSTLAGEGARV